MAIAISLALFLILAATISYYGYRRYARPARVYEQLGGKAAYATPTLDDEANAGPGLVVTMFEQIGEKVPIHPDDASQLRHDLMAAGYRSENAPLVYIGARVALAGLLVLIALLVRGYISDKPAVGIILPVVGGIIGYFAPSLYLDSRIARRHEILRLALPDALDLMVVSVEAGLGLDQAIQYVSRELYSSHPELCWELQTVNNEIRAGARRVEALRHLAERTGEPEIRKLVAVLIQTDKFGTSVADSLRTHSDFMRVRRRQEAEERANKVGVKLVFPIFFLILPSMLVVAAGPGLLQVFKYLFPLMRNFQL
jgi:tight adherence protein C